MLQILGYEILLVWNMPKNSQYGPSIHPCGNFGYLSICLNIKFKTVTTTNEAKLILSKEMITSREIEIAYVLVLGIYIAGHWVAYVHASVK